MKSKILIDLFGHEKKVILVTGSNGQLGKAICDTYLKIGAFVIGIDKSIDNDKLAGVNYYQCDISKRSKLKELFNLIYEKYRKIDCLINNAGVSVFEPYEKRRNKDLQFVFDVNLKGTFYCTQVFVEFYTKYNQSKASIVNIGSIYGIISPDFRIYTDCKRKNSEIYGATKAGVIQMTKYFGVHLAKYGIRVNAVSPGGIYNPKNPQGKDFVDQYSFRCPMGRMADDKEIIGAILYLTSNSASYTTGHNLIVDGGISCW